MRIHVLLLVSIVSELYVVYVTAVYHIIITVIIDSIIIVNDDSLVILLLPPGHKLQLTNPKVPIGCIIIRC